MLAKSFFLMGMCLVGTDVFFSSGKWSCDLVEHVPASSFSSNSLHFYPAVFSKVCFRVFKQQVSVVDVMCFKMKMC